MSIILNDSRNYHNKKEYLEKLFKVKLPKRINKVNFEIAYALAGTRKYVTEEDFKVIYEDVIEHQKEYEGMYVEPTKRRQISNAISVIERYVAKKQGRKMDGVDYRNYRRLVADWAYMGIQLKQKINVQAGKERIQEEHDCFSLRIQKKKDRKKLRIPKTPLKYLKLPKEFHMITTRKELIEESETQHNCVASYLDYINSGRCVIFTGDVDGEHLTIEVRYDDKKKGFEVMQCLTTYNRACKRKTKTYVKRSVKEAGKKAMQSYERSKRRGTK